MTESNAHKNKKTLEFGNRTVLLQGSEINSQIRNLRQQKNGHQSNRSLRDKTNMKAHTHYVLL